VSEASSARDAQARWTPAYVALGSNLDEPARQVLRAFRALAELPQTRLVARSGLYRSPPFGPVSQPDFVNAVAGVLTQLGPEALLGELKALELRLGRAAPVVRWGPRSIDLDLLAHGSSELSTDTLALPHPGIAQRAFVLVPWCDVSPAFEVPKVGRVSALAGRIDRGGLERIEER
jgi:2-amino-4-hydroxy-6-hydroxymethyldihydropteridine diphosphokinase